MNYDEILRNIRLLSNGQHSEKDISALLIKHNCNYLLKQYKTDIKDNIFNKICINERYKACKNIFSTFEKNNISYAVIKGAVLSKMAYNDETCRKSGDIDLLLCRDDIDIAKQIMLNDGFVQGRITDNGIETFSRNKLLFQLSASHQTAPFVKKTTNPVCPYVNVDINLDIFWGESILKPDMKNVLKYTEPTEIRGIKTKKLIPVMEFISLCLHHYKDANSIYLLWQGNLKLSLFCDIYFYLKHNSMDLQVLKDFCNNLQTCDYVYYCVYYANEIFNDSLLLPYLEALKTETSENILNNFGLAKKEVKHWNINFFERLFSHDLRSYLENNLGSDDMNKIKINSKLM